MGESPKQLQCRRQEGEPPPRQQFWCGGAGSLDDRSGNCSRGVTIGGLLAWMMSEEFQPVPQTLMELPPAERQKLVNEVSEIIKNLPCSEAVHLTALVMNNHAIELILSTVVNFIKKLKA